MKLLPLALLAAVLFSRESIDEVAAFRCGSAQGVTLANVRDVYAAYGARSVAIVQSALAGDVTSLSQMVAPTAKFTIFHGDMGVGPRSKGALAAISFVEQISPRSYRFSAGSAGPFSMNPCGPATVELTFIGNQPDEAVVASFEYQNGVLVEVQSSAVELISGDFYPAPAR